MDPTPDTGAIRGEVKTRRPHRKSRYGCAKCKERRIKCDELTPRCSRCTKMNLVCQYRKKEDPRGSLRLISGTPGSAHGARSPGSPGRSGSCSAAAGNGLPSPLALERAGSPLQPMGVAQTLAPIELELFRHYLEHTSRDLTVDEGDQYALRIGIPSLACQSRPLMRSVLALAAVCKCSDIIHSPSSTLRKKERGRVVELLSLAQAYHVESLREIQTTLHEAETYDHVLANAAMMGMYGSGSQCARIWLAKTATPDDRGACELMETGHPQWLSLFRAVRLAYAGLLNDAKKSDGPAPSPAEAASASPGAQVQHECEAPSQAEQPRAPTNHPLGPILAATVRPALARLHEMAAEVAAASSDINADPDLQACFTTLAILGGIVTAAFPADDSRGASGRVAPGPHHSRRHHEQQQQQQHRGSRLAPPVDIPPTGRLAQVSPWLRRYTASISSMTPSRLPRRTIMALVHKAPARFLNLVEDMRGIMGHAATPDAAGGAPPPPSPSPPSIQPTPPSCSPSTPFSPSATPSTCAPAEDWEGEQPQRPSAAHRLAVEIFAHWLVLVMLLDDVWWIGDIGAWELGRIVAGVRRRGPWGQWDGGGVVCDGARDCWWPESMLQIGRLLDRHRRN